MNFSEQVAHSSEAFVHAFQLARHFMKLFDAHNHLQDPRLDHTLPELEKIILDLGIVEMVVNGTAERDWPQVASLAERLHWVRPSFGLHPWYVKQRGVDWLERLRDYLLLYPRSVVGEIGLDQWIKNADFSTQRLCFQQQLALAVELDRPVTIHCLRAWGHLEEEMRRSKLCPQRFLLHSYTGPIEMIPSWVQMGAYFSLSPYFAHARKAQQLAVFAAVPLERLLVETDAPDMWPPDEWNRYPLICDGKSINHPANLVVSYNLLARVRGMVMEDLVSQIETNFRRLFG